jgi:selenide,water dikinase
VLSRFEIPVTPEVLVGLHTGDDAGVYRIADDLALVLTVDFITPVVDDPFLFGQISAANSLSDVYAMGGTPMAAMNVLCCPSCGLGTDVLGEILAGGAAKIREAGASLVGGHTVENPELVYGLSVTGRVDPRSVFTNAGARPGDLLVLTEPLGLGLISTAVKAGLADASDEKAMGEIMARLNLLAARWLADFGATAVTDVTGFGLAGHLLGICRESGVDAVLSWSRVPLLSGAQKALTIGLIPAGAYRNRDAYRPRLTVEAPQAEDVSLLLCDPQTSGGLLVALPPDRAEAYAARLNDEGLPHARVIGELVEGNGLLLVR